MANIAHFTRTIANVAPSPRQMEKRHRVRAPEGRSRRQSDMSPRPCARGTVQARPCSLGAEPPRVRAPCIAPVRPTPRPCTTPHPCAPRVRALGARTQCSRATARTQRICSPGAQTRHHHTRAHGCGNVSFRRRLRPSCARTR